MNSEQKTNKPNFQAIANKQSEIIEKPNQTDNIFNALISILAVIFVLLLLFLIYQSNSVSVKPFQSTKQDLTILSPIQFPLMQIQKDEENKLDEIISEVIDREQILKEILKESDVDYGESLTGQKVQLRKMQSPEKLKIDSSGDIKYNTSTLDQQIVEQQSIDEQIITPVVPNDNGNQEEEIKYVNKTQESNIQSQLEATQQFVDEQVISDIIQTNSEDQLDNLVTNIHEQLIILKQNFEDNVPDGLILEDNQDQQNLTPQIQAQQDDVIIDQNLVAQIQDSQINKEQEIIQDLNIFQEQDIHLQGKIQAD